MKKICMIFGMLCLFQINLPGYAECNCSYRDVAKMLSSSSSIYLDEALENMLDDADFSPSSSIRHSFAKIIYAAKDEPYFQEALKNYINSSCRVGQENRIYCD